MSENNYRISGVAQLKDDYCGVDILSALLIQGTSGTPILKNYQNHPAHMQRRILLLKSTAVWPENYSQG